jgi:hypothetical protein
MHDQSHVLEGLGDVVKLMAYLRIPKVGADVISLLAKLQCNHFMHLVIKSIVVIERRDQSTVKRKSR